MKYELKDRKPNNRPLENLAYGRMFAYTSNPKRVFIKGQMYDAVQVYATDLESGYVTTVTASSQDWFEVMPSKPVELVPVAVG